MRPSPLACLRGVVEDRLALACFLLWVGSNLLSLLVNIWIAVGGVAIGLGIAVLLSGRLERETLRLTPAAWGIGLSAGGLMTAVTYLLYPLAGHLVPAVVTQAAALYATFGGAGGWTAALVLPLVVVAEELVWRGVVQDAFTRHCGAAAGVLLTTAAYGIAVVPVGSVLLVAIALACGLYWSLLRAWTGRLSAVLVAHLVWDLFVFLLVPLAR